MTRARSLSILGILAIAACAEPTLPPAQPTLTAGGRSSSVSADDASGTYLVRFKKGIPSDFESSVTAMGGEVIWTHAGVGLGAVAGISSANAAALEARSDIAAVDPDAYTTLGQPTDASTESTDALQSTTNPAGAFFFPLQWNMRAIHANDAWAAGKLGKATTRVGILDTGIGYTHVDLKGLVDLAASRSFLSAAENARVTTMFPGANVIADLHFHGTHVSATVASNAQAAAGVTSKVTLVGVKVCAPGNAANGFQGLCPTSAVLGGMLYAADIGLDVINMSLGGSFAKRDASARGGFGPSFIATINAVFHYVHGKGTAVVVAAGNDAMDLQHNGNVYDAYCDAPNAICVSATGPTSGNDFGPWGNIDALAFYSNFGKNHITVAAPGGNAGFNPNGKVQSVTYVWAACSPFTIITSILVCRTSPTFIVNSLGTSMAAPHVTGLAALIAGDVGHNPDAIADRIQSSADNLGALSNRAFYGSGRINVARGTGL